MTNDEAIYTLKNTAFLGWSEQAEKVSEAVQMAVEALKRETSDDAIDRHDAIDALMEILDRPNHAEFLYADEICKALNELPSVQPERTEERTETHACDCISRQAVRFIESNSDSYPEEWNDDYEKGFTDALNKVIALPSVQPDIIYCKDCKHWREGTAFSYCDKLHGMGVLDALDYMTAEDDYCSMAERRTDGEIIPE